MNLGSRIFVFVIFAILGLSFIVSTATLAWEFNAAQRWVDFLANDSHLFVFFPTFAIIALVAFYLPSCAVVDLYWHHLKFGKLRFSIGFIVVAVAAWVVGSSILAGKNKPMWEIKPAVLLSDSGEPADCAAAGSGGCSRLPALNAIRNLRLVSQNRSSLQPFVRKCRRDPFIDEKVQEGHERLCIASTPYSDKPQLKSDAACCAAQKELIKTVRNMSERGRAPEADSFQSKLMLPLKHFDEGWANSSLSLTGAVHAAFLPLKAFFLLMLVAMSLLLTSQFKNIERLYSASLPKIEIGVLIGTFSTLLFPLMSQAFLQSNEALLGDIGYGAFSRIVPIMSFIFGVWTLLILLFFYRRRDKEVELAGKIAGAAAGIVALLKYDSIVAFLVRAVGSGASPYALAGLGIVALVVAVVTMYLIARPAVQDRTAHTP